MTLASIILLRLYQRVRQAAFSIVGSTIRVLEAPADTTGKFLLKLRINLYGATTMLRYKNVCANCEKQEGKKKGILSPIDFKTTSDMILPQDGKLRIDFIFAATRRPTDWGMANNFVLSEDVDSSLDNNFRSPLTRCLTTVKHKL